jgi:phosphate-selective porin OprO/OprP
MSRDFLARLRRFVCLGAQHSPVAMLLLAAALQTGPAAAQAPQYPNPSPYQTANPVQPTPPVNLAPVPLPATGTNVTQAATQPVQPVGYNAVATNTMDARLIELENTVRQQAAIMASMRKQMQPGGMDAQVPGADTAPSDSFYPGSAAPAPSSGASSAPYVVGSDRAFTGSWTNDGPLFKSKNGDFTFHPRWVSQLDFIGVQTPSAGVGVPGGAGTQDSVDFRRLRLGCDGTMWETIDYVFEFDFAFALQNIDPANGATPVTGLRSGGTVNAAPGTQSGNTTNAVQPTTVFTTFKELPLVGNMRIGNQQDWISMEHIESARFQDFMERSPLMDAFNGPNNNGYAPGISLFRSYFEQNLSIQVGAYKANYYDSGFPYDIGNSNYSYGGRVHWTPYYDEPTHGRYLVHVGVGTEFRQFNNQPLSNTDGTNVRIRARGDVRNTASTLNPNFVDTGNFYALGQNLICPEMAIVWGPWLFKAEYEASWMTGASSRKGGTSLGNVLFQGGYAEVLYFLTGENRTYQRLPGVFGRVIPNSNAYLVRGAGFSKGAWQVGARVDTLDLNSGAVQGGNVTNLTLGLNWFLNPNMRLQFNYVHSKFDNAPNATFPGTAFSLNGSRFVGDGHINMIGSRIDFNF